MHIVASFDVSGTSVFVDGYHKVGFVVNDIIDTRYVGSVDLTFSDVVDNVCLDGLEKEGLVSSCIFLLFEEGPLKV